MRITARELNRSTLGRQLLLRREPLGAVDAVRRLVALQAQHAASPYLALWNRLSGFDPADLDAAFGDRAIVKATLVRITLHAIHRDDYRSFREAMHPTLRAARLNSRFTASGLSPDDADALVPELLTFADRPRTTAEMEAWLEARIGVPPKSGAWWGLRSYAPLVHAPTGGPWSFGLRPSYVASGARPALDPDPSAASLQTLARRYLEGFGPASVADIAQFATVQRAQGPSGGGRALRHPGGVGRAGRHRPVRPPRRTAPGGRHPAPPRLMAMWDSSCWRTPTAAASSRRIPAPGHPGER